MSIHLLHEKQIIRATIAEAWDFFSNPGNLSRITPPDMGFVVKTAVPPRIHAGLMIKYRVSPLFGLPMTWLTEITHVRENEYFVDEQRVGPYAIWHHEHHFHPLGGGRVELEDRVTYRLPLAPFSEVIHPLLVAPKLKQIFDFRRRRIEEIFGSPQHDVTA